MTTTQGAHGAIPSFDKVKMEERKRSLVLDVDELAPSRKRLVKDENGQAMRMDAEKEKDVENYQKDALLRQMKEYKRQRKDFEDQYTTLSKKCQYHDDHLRIIDAWFAQLLDEVRILASQALPTPPASATPVAGEETYGSALLFENNEDFSTHLRLRSDGIKSAISALFGQLPSASSEVVDLRRQLNELLSKEKEHAVELRRALDNQQSLDERLEIASERYMRAEKRLDRAKSSQVLKLERQAIFGGSDAASPTASKKGSTLVKKETSEANGDVENGVDGVESELARKEASAAAERQKAQLSEVEADNERLTNELSAARTKLASLSDEDYAETSLFKTFKTRFDDAVQKLNDLQATNVQLREEVQTLQSERTSYRIQIDDDSRAQANEIEAQIARAETDLARIRAGRDDVVAELSIRKSGEDQRRTSADQARELAEARNARISSLESEVERLKTQIEGPADSATIAEDLEGEALKAKYRSLHGQYALLSNELSSMEAAWRKTSTLASRKVDDVAAQEDTVARLAAEKTKAEQKYFAAMKAKDTREGELRFLKSQNSRSSEIVSQLKDSESKTRELVANLEGQLAELREYVTKLEQQHRTSEQKANEAASQAEGIRKQMQDLKDSNLAKDKDALTVAKTKRELEVDLEKAQTRLEDAKKQISLLQKSRAADNTATSDDWRKVAICPICNRNIRNTVIKSCGHVFCHECVKDLISLRSRKCPSCGRAFGNNDHMGIVLT